MRNVLKQKNWSRPLQITGTLHDNICWKSSINIYCNFMLNSCFENTMDILKLRQYIKLRPKLSRQNTGLYWRLYRITKGDCVCNETSLVFCQVKKNTILTNTVYTSCHVSIWNRKYILNNFVLSSQMFWSSSRNLKKF